MTACAVSPDKEFYYASDAAEKVSVHIFKADPEEAKAVESVQISKKVTHIQATDGGLGVTGQDFASFIKVDDSGKPELIKCKQGNDPVSHTCVAFSSDDMMWTSGVDGNLYQWTKEGELK